MHILLIEDNPDHRMIIQMILEREDKEIASGFVYDLQQFMVPSSEGEDQKETKENLEDWISCREKTIKKIKK